jgi:transposase
MYGKKLTDTEVAQRMVELRNLRTLHAVSRKRERYKDVRIQELETTVAGQQTVIATLQIQLAELQTMVFGRKKRPPTGGTPVGPDTGLSVPEKLPRSKASYRRPIPPASSVTAEEILPLPAVCACGGSFAPDAVTAHERFVEDIPLPELTPGYRAQLVTKYRITKGICIQCGKATTGGNTNLGGAQVTLGPNVRLLVAHLMTVGGMSYQQVANLLLTLYGLAISKGEMAGILARKHLAWFPAYTQLGADIRAAPVVHADETPWKIQAEGGGYAWVLADASSPRVWYDLATSRGAPHAQSLFGQGTDQPFAGVRISDDYGAYRNPELPGRQQLCWAHLYRSIRDLRHNKELPQKQAPYVTRWYASFAGIYQDLRQCLGEPYDASLREQQAAELWQRVQHLAQAPAPKAGEPDKLTRLKAQLLRAGQDRLFVCLPKNTPCDNNRAERDLRQLVLKRKRSFGSQTEKGAKAFATILSVCTTTWRTNPGGYFRALALLG